MSAPDTIDDGKGNGLLARARSRIVAISQRGVVRSVGVLVTGTMVAHAITMVTMVVSTRLYTPEHFSALSVFQSLWGILIVVICLRYDAAVVMPEKDEDGASLLVLSITLAALASLLVGAVMLVLPDSVYAAMNVPSLLPYLWLLPLAVFVGGVYNAMQAWFVRMKRFGRIAQNRATQAAIASASQIGLGFAGIAPLGLLASHMLNYGAGSVSLLAQAVIRDRAVLGKAGWRELVKVARTYRRFPMYSVWEGLANGFSNAAPVIIIAAMSPGPEAGFLALSLFVLQAPLALLGNAVGQVFLSEAPKAYRERRLGEYTGDTLAGLAMTGSGPMLFAAIVSPTVFGFVFGSEWTRSGELVTWMAPWFFLQFLASPTCNALHVSGHQRLMMVFHLAGMVLRVGGVLTAGLVAVEFISEAWAVTGWILYAAYVAIIMVVARVPARKIVAAVKKSVPSLIAGAIFGIVVVMAFRFLGIAG